MNDQSVTRESVDALDAALGQSFPVLNDGFVRVIDYMGGDAAVVQAARVSYGKGTKHVSADRSLIRYLLRHRHTTPFEMCVIKLHVRVPMDCWRQWIRHRMASVNEYSTRYSLAIDAAQSTAPDEWRRQSNTNRQGSGDYIDFAQGQHLTARETELQSLCRTVYRERIDQGVSREQARKDLPLSTYTEAYWKTDLHNLLHFLALRMDPAAQQEIRAYARVIGEEIVKRWVPMVWEAFLDYRLNGASFSRQEMELTGLLLQGRRDVLACRLWQWGWLKRDPNAADASTIKPSREALEWFDKVLAMGVELHWDMFSKQVSTPKPVRA